jgi:hypothetical protein
MSYAIVCDARRGEGFGIETLALADRSKTKKLWWTSDDPYLILNSRKKDAALFAAKRLTRNNPQVVDYSAAVSLIRHQSNEIAHQEAMMDSEMGWDAHKDQF